MGFQGSGRSEILSPEFFLSASGSEDPYSELLATLEAFSEPTTEDTNQHAQCRFPARRLWLSRQLPLKEYGIERVECPDYRGFSAAGDINSVSLVYATGFLGNPASYYGHLLVKLNEGSGFSEASLDNTAINYGAIIPDNENMLVYIAKGFLGGYHSGYTHREYYYHTHNYGENELRDLWEYRLKFSEEDQALFVAHSWELIGMQYRYYFLNRNCAYQIAQLLALVTEDDLVDKRRPWVLPQSVIQTLDDQEYQGRPLVQDVRYIPSRQTRLYARFGELNGAEQEVVRAVIKEPERLQQSPLTERDIESQQRILDALLDYYQYRLADGPGDRAELFERRHRNVLLARFSLPEGQTAIEYSSRDRPHKGRKPSYTSLGAIYDDEGRHWMRLRLRPAYYDSLDSGEGAIGHATLTMGELVLSARPDKVKIHRLSLVDIENVNRNLTRLPGDRARSWRISTGFTQRNLRCESCLALKLDTATGYATSLWQDTVVLGAYVGGGYFAEDVTRGGWYLSSNLSANLNLTERLGARLESGVRTHYRGLTEDFHKVEARWALGAQTDIRLSYRQVEGRQVGMSIGYYW